MHQVQPKKTSCFLVQIEELGSEGRVEEAQGMMKLVEQLKEERELLSSTPSVSHTASGRPAFSRLFNLTFLKQRGKRQMGHLKCCAFPFRPSRALLHRRSRWKCARSAAPF